MALILTRRPGETLVMTTPAGEQVRLTVICVLGPKGRDQSKSKVRFQISANVGLNVRPTEVVHNGHAMSIGTPSGEQISVIVMGIKGNQVRIGTEADKPVVIDREEIHRRRVAEANAA